MFSIQVWSFRLFFFMVAILIRKTFGYQVVYDSNFGSGTCSASYMTMWSTTSCSQNHPCSYYMMSTTPATITMDLSTLTLYSFLIFEIQVVSTVASVDYYFGSASSTTIGSLSIYSIDVCSHADNYSAILTKSKSSVGSSLSFTLACTSGGKTNKYGIRSLKITANCSGNCVTCLTDTSCSVCMQGMARVLAPSGDYLCEQTLNCTSITGCFACLIDNSGTTISCTQCRPGYTLSGSGTTCTSLGSCSAGKYMDPNGTCYSYSSTCIQQASDGTQGTCDSSITPADYLCPVNKTLLVYSNLNYQVYTCICSAANCLSCNGSTTTCTTCTDGYYFQTSSGTCVTCTDVNCAICPTASTCSSCKTNYVLNSGSCQTCSNGYYYSTSSGGSCIACTDTNCEICPNSTSCTSCKTNYVLASGVCQTCSNGYYYSSTSGGSCIACTDSNCSVCPSSSSCTSCKTTYVLVSGVCQTCSNGYYYSTTSGGSCLPCTDTNCSICPTSSTCTTCNTNYVLNSGVCQICSNGYYYSSASGGTCIACTDTNCSVCPSSSSCTSCKANYVLVSGVCQTCSSGYYYSAASGGSCIACTETNCSICPTSSSCTSCKTNYVLTSGVCQICSNGFYYSSASGGSCIACSDSNCFSCTSSACTTCNTNYSPNSSTGICELCSSGYYYSSSSSPCVACSDSNCQTCTATSCSICKTNYILNSSTSSCELCPNGKYYSSGTCVDCFDSNCSVCSSTACSSCNVNYVLNSTTGFCEQCQNGYFYQSTTKSCVACSDANCKNCTSLTSCTSCNAPYVLNSSTLTCQACSNGSYFSSSSGGTCLPCTDSNCAICLSANSCSSCSPNYVLNTSSSTCEVCQNGTYYQSSSSSCVACSDPNCFSCTSSNCASCKSNYVYNSTSNLCQVCSIGLYYSNGICLPCLDPNSKTCSAGNISTSCNDPYILSGNTCVPCTDGYYFASGTCVSCPDSHCKQCPGGTSSPCSICKSNFQLDITSGLCKQTQGCLASQYLDPISQLCVDCSDNCASCTSTTCLSCISSDYYYVDPSNIQKCKRNGKTNSFTISQKTTNDGYIISLTFENNLVSKEGSNDILDVLISGVSSSKETISISENIITITKLMNDACKNKQGVISFKSQSFEQLNGITQQNAVFDLKNQATLSISQQQESSAAASVGSVFSYANASTFLPIVILSNFYILVNTIDLTGFLYYLLFINVRLPQNVLSFFGIFKNFQFPFIPNVFSYAIQNGYAQQAPQRFMDMSNDAYFINSAGQSITIITVFLIVYFIIKILSKLPIPVISPYLKAAIKRTWEYGSFFDALCAVYIYILAGALLQLTVYDFGDRTYLLNYILHSIWTVISIAVPFFILWLLYRVKNFKSDKIAQQKWSSLIGGIVLYDNFSVPRNAVQPLPNEGNDLDLNKEKSNIKQSSDTDGSQLLHSNENPKILTRRQYITMRTSHLCNGFMYLRKLFFIIIIVYLYNRQYTQLVLISLLNIVIASYILYVRPYETKGENIKNAIGEIFLIGIQISVATLVDDPPDQSEESRFAVGWVIICLSAFVLLWNTVLIVVDALKSIFVLIVSVFRKKSTKVIPIIKIECPKDDIQKDNFVKEQQNGTDIQRIKPPHSISQEPHLLEDDWFSNQINPMISSNMLYSEKTKLEHNNGGFSASDSTQAPTLNHMPPSPLIFLNQENHETDENKLFIDVRTMTKNKSKKKIREKKQHNKEDEIIYIHENNNSNSLSNNVNNNNVNYSNEIENNNKKVENMHQSGIENTINSSDEEKLKNEQPSQQVRLLKNKLRLLDSNNNSPLGSTSPKAEAIIHLKKHRRSHVLDISYPTHPVEDETKEKEI